MIAITTTNLTATLRQYQLVVKEKFNIELYIKENGYHTEVSFFYHRKVIVLSITMKKKLTTGTSYFIVTCYGVNGRGMTRTYNDINSFNKLLDASVNLIGSIVENLKQKPTIFRYKEDGVYKLSFNKFANREVETCFVEDIELVELLDYILDEKFLSNMILEGLVSVLEKDHDSKTLKKMLFEMINKWKHN